jgi:hypothetical protein
MAKRGYGRPFSSALTAASSILANLIPPSLGLIIYAALASVSVFAGVALHPRRRGGVCQGAGWDGLSGRLPRLELSMLPSDPRSLRAPLQSGRSSSLQDLSNGYQALM